MRYDENENLTSVQLPDGAVASWKYDVLGNCIQATDANGHVRQYQYDQLNRLCNMYLPDGNTIRLTYDAYDEIVHATDKYGHVQFEYTPLGKPIKRKQGGTELRFFYDTQERLTSVVNEAGRHYALNYNKRGEITSETGFDGSQRAFERDVTGKVIKTVRPGNRFTEYEYDANGRVTRVTYDDCSWELYTYDRNGNLKEAINEHSHVQLNRNKMGYITAEQQDEYIVQHQYNTLGECVQITSNLGVGIQLQHDPLGQVTRMQARQHSQLWEAQLQYNQAGQEIERLLPGGIISEWKYDGAGRPGDHRVTKGGVLQSWKKYTWDAGDRLTNIFDAIAQENTHFKHDVLGNLVFAQYADSSIVHRAMDGTSNIYETTAKTDRTFNNAGALLESAKHIYHYDEEGNLVSKTEKGTSKKTKYEWYANGRLKKVVRADGKEITFTYDALGRRISKKFNGVITRWVWDGDRPLHEWSYPEKEKPQQVVNEWGEISYSKQEPSPANEQSTMSSITWLFEPDNHRLAAKIANGAVFSVITDHLGTPQWMYNTSGKKVWEGVLDIYGRVRYLHGTNSDLPFRYQGQYEDVETGLYYNRFRYYNPEEGMYVSQDPIRLHSGQPNFYAYVHDPNSWVDVFGLFELFRSMSRAEYYDIKANGWKEGGGATMSGKWFAESAEHATQWGHTMGHGSDTKFYIVKVEVLNHIADAAYQNPRLDGIGPARYLEVADLNAHSKITEVTSVRVQNKVNCG